MLTRNISETFLSFTVDRKGEKNRQEKTAARGFFPASFRLIVTPHNRSRSKTKRARKKPRISSSRLLWLVASKEEVQIRVHL